MANSEDLCSIITEFIDESYMEKLFEIPELNILYEKVDEKQRENPGLKIDDVLMDLTSERNNVPQQQNESEAYKSALYLTNENDDFLYGYARMEDVCPYGSPPTNNSQSHQSADNLQLTSSVGRYDGVEFSDINTFPLAEISLPQLNDPTQGNSELSTINMSHLQIQNHECGSQSSSQRSRRQRTTKKSTHHTRGLGHGAPTADLWQSDTPSLLSYPSSLSKDEIHVSGSCSSAQSQVLSPYAPSSPMLDDSSMSSPYMNDLASSSSYSPFAPSPGSECLDSHEGAQMTMTSSSRVKKTGTRSKQRTLRMSLSGLSEQEKRLRVRDQNNRASRCKKAVLRLAGVSRLRATTSGGTDTHRDRELEIHSRLYI
ncbi:hypothetical protein FHG87_003748 [Trinorchestia longiramus]|nr:hypothetical protein FHG87_003748 [Trinorchestia longiramus]